MANIENIQGQGFHTNPERINRAGRPKGALSLSTILIKALKAKTTDNEGNEIKRFHKVVANLLKTAESEKDKDKIRAIQEIFDRVEGKPLQKSQTEITTKEPIIIDWTTTDTKAEGSTQDSK